MGFIADVAGRQNTLVLSVLGSAISVVAFWLSSAYGDSTSLWITFVVTYGLFAGGMLSFGAQSTSTDIKSRV
jgi:MFS family permease